MSSRGGVLSFIRSFGLSLHNDLTHSTTEVTSEVDPEPQLELAHEGTSNTIQETDASIEKVSFFPLLTIDASESV
jgi:hypothetical protein